MSWNDLDNRWKQYFIDILHTTANMSKDENTKVGSLIIDTERKVVVSSSWNDLPRGVKHNSERNSRPLKYLYTLHAEQGCLINALRLNVDVNNLTMLTTLGCCPQCSCSIVNSGIKEVVTPALDYNHISCGELYQHSELILREGGVIWSFDNSLGLNNLLTQPNNIGYYLNTLKEKQT